MKRTAAFCLGLVCVSAWMSVSPLPAHGAAHRGIGGYLALPEAVAGPYRTTPAARTLARWGYLVSDPAAFLRDKGAPAALTHVGLSRVSGHGAPVAFRSWKGVYDTLTSPSDSTGAIGSARYVELVNDKFAIYDRTSNTALSTGTLATLTGDTTGSLTDPQIIWDPGTSRFYYAVLAFSDDVFDVGFSKTATPGTASDWCKYSDDQGYGSNVPDYPKLGDTQDFLLIGVNVFSAAGAYLRSDVNWITKPPAGRTCPSATSFLTGQRRSLLNADGTKAFTPVPANQTDTSSSGWVVAAKGVIAGPAATLSVFSVTKKADGTANIAGTGTPVSVASYAVPPSAPQKGTSSVLDTMDGRLTQAVSATDPSRGVVAVWTQHTVAGGAGSEVRWYEIDAGGHAQLQTGKATSASLDVFNGAIAPDRLVTGASAAFGDSMVLGFDTSSSSTDVAFQILSKIGPGSQSAFVLVRQSAGPNVDFTCFDPYGPPCRWGDYGGASPDPGASLTGSHGQVWLTNTYNVSSTTNSNVDWRTENVGATP